MPETFSPVAYAERLRRKRGDVDLFQSLMRQDRALVSRGWPKLTPWWTDVLERFYSENFRRLVARVGRRGTKSSSMCRIAVNEMLNQNYWIPPGEIGVWPFFSISTGEADDRLYTIAAILDTLGIPHTDSTDRRGHYVALLNRPLAFRVMAASFRTGVGFLGVGASFDELARWHDDSRSANPATHVLSSVRPSMRNQPMAHEFMLSSPWSTLDAHAEAIERGTTAKQLVVEAATWEANPTITRDDCLEDEADEMTFQREYGAVPMPAGAVCFFDPAAVQAACDRPQIKPRGGDQIVAGADLGFRRDSSALCVCAIRGGHYHVLEYLEMKPEGVALRPSDVIAKFAQVLAKHDATCVMADSHYRESLIEHLEPHNISVLSAPMDVPKTYVHFRSLLHQGRISMKYRAHLSRDLSLVQSAPTATGRVRISLPRNDAGHADLVSALVLACWQNSGDEIETDESMSPIERLRLREQRYEDQLFEGPSYEDLADELEYWTAPEEEDF